MSVRVEEWRVKRRDTEEWMRHRQLPPELQERVRQFVQYKWLATRGVDEEFILHSLPLDLRREIQRHLCLSLVRRVCLYCQLFFIYLSSHNLHFVITFIIMGNSRLVSSVEKCQTIFSVFINRYSIHTSTLKLSFTNPFLFNIIM